MDKLRYGDHKSDRYQHIWVESSAMLTDCVARMCFSKDSALLKSSKLKYQSSGNRSVSKSLLVALSFLLSGVSTTVFAMGVGSAITESYIGETLAVRVPLFNIESPNSLTVTLTQDQSSSARLQAQIDRSNSQIGVLVSSDSRVNEPYLNFTLELSDNNNLFSREFTVLLNLSPQLSSSTEPLSQTPQDQNQLGQNPTSDFRAQPLGSNRLVGVNSLMGPYDWAEAGRVPERFGAVLDGQSLWRVARRINQGLGVSINQMMWSLYQQNPNAFSSASINSLKAGSYLTIPTFQVASQLSDSEAKSRLDNTLTNSLVSSSEVVPSAGRTPEQAVRGVERASDEATQQFQLTAIDETVTAGGSVTGASDGKSQEIISSLAETVGNLTQELIRKDKQIALLEEKVTALAEFAGVDADVIDSSLSAPEIDGQRSAVELEADDLEVQASLDTDLVVLDDASSVDKELLEDEETLEELTDLSDGVTDLAENELSDPVIVDTQLTDTDQIDLDAAVTSDAAEQEVKIIEPQGIVKSFFQDMPLWKWAALLLVGIVLLAGLFRRRLVELFASLNLMNRDDGVEFKQSVFDSTDAPIGNVPKAAEVETQRDYSVMSAVKRDSNQDEAIEGVSYLAVNEYGEYEETNSEDFTHSDLEFVDDEDMTFAERFERLLKEKDYDFARELLDFARYNEIDDERYHCERLRLLQAMQDEDGFYEYYYEIESKIPSFAPNYQTQISQLVVELSQTER